MDRPKAKRRKQELLYIIGCEGRNQERLYFKKLQLLFNGVEERKYDVIFEFAEPFGGDPKCIVERTLHKSIGKENRAAVFDYDGKEEKYEEAIDLGRQNHILLGYSNYCFDLWLLLHKMDFFEKVESQKDYAALLRKAYRLSYNANIKKEGTVEKMLSRIRLDDVRAAIGRAGRLEEKNRVNGASCRTPGGSRYYQNPDTRMHRLLLTIMQAQGLPV